jgi:uncharacterized protein YbjT (DUF2867 family)
MTNDAVFITGGTGYMGKRLIKILLDEGFKVTALVRQQSIKKLPAGCLPVIANPFDAASYADSIHAEGIFIHLLGVSHPGPKKKSLFYSVDLASLKASVEAAKQAGVKHFVYSSVAQYPTKIMADYQEARKQGEQVITESGLTATFVRPWYVVGPGHYWPMLFSPVFKLLQVIPATSVQARSLAIVTLKQILLTLKRVVLNPPEARINIFEIRDIKNIEPFSSGRVPELS